MCARIRIRTRALAVLCCRCCCTRFAMHTRRTFAGIELARVVSKCPRHAKPQHNKVSRYTHSGDNKCKAFGKSYPHMCVAQCGAPVAHIFSTTSLVQFHVRVERLTGEAHNFALACVGMRWKHKPTNANANTFAIVMPHCMSSGRVFLGTRVYAKDQQNMPGIVHQC